jgi:hypothetical protein
MNKPKNDPKEIVTPDAFKIDPSLLGHPLASPARRLIAVIIDLIIAGILSMLGGILLGIVAAAIFFWIAIRKKDVKSHNPYWRWLSAGLAAILFFFVVVGVLNKKRNTNTKNDELNTEQVSQIHWTEYLHKALNAGKQDTIPVDKALERIGNELEKNIKEVQGDTTITPVIPGNAAQILQAYATAYKRENKTVMDSLRKNASIIIDGQELSKLHTQNRLFLNELATLKVENEKLKKKAMHPGIMTFIKSQADDLGLAVGWIGIYFTICLAWMEGQTPGKRVLKLKVVQLDGRPLTLWSSFGRFGGYAAGFATGLLGFVQIYWDPNRQAIHDQISRTVVLDLRKKKRLGVQHIIDEYQHKKDTDT